MAESAPNPQAALAKYNYPGADKDDQVVTTVENKIKNSPMGKFQAWLDSKPPVESHEVEGKKKEYKDQIDQAVKEHPDEAKKQPPPQNIATAPAVKPQVTAAGGKGGAAPAPKPQKAGAPPPKKGGGPSKPGKGGPAGEHKAPKAIAFAAANVADADIGKWLNEYPNKSKEVTQKLGKIQQMQEVANGFDGKVEGYIANGGALDAVKGKGIEFLGKKEMNAIFQQNPYEKVGGGLGRIMRGLSVFKNIASIVGNVAGKIGLILTVVGLLGMIFPPVGAAVQGIARVLNVIGLVCDAIGLILGAILTGLNGVQLARQIAKGGSNEEKAATADMMAQEANDAGGHVINLAMSFGPKFMKGMLGQSKGVIAGLMKRFKAVVGRLMGRVTGAVGNWAKKAIYKMGFLLEDSKNAGFMSKAKAVFNSPGKALEKLRNTDLVKRINNSGFMQKLEKGGVAADKWGARFDGEKLGEKVGNVGADTSFAKHQFEAAERTEQSTLLQAQKTAGEDAANREKARIEREIAGKEKLGNSEYEKSVAGGKGVSDSSAAARSVKAYDEAQELRDGEKDVSNQATKDAVKKTSHEQRVAAKAEEKEAERIKAFREHPENFQKGTALFEKREAELQQKLAAPDLSKAEKGKLEHELEEVRETVNARRVIPVKAVGGETPETLWDVKKAVTEGWNAAHLKDEAGEKAEERKKVVEKAFGHNDTEDRENAERHHEFENVAAETAKEPAHGTEEHVEGMLSGIGGEVPHEDPAATSGDSPGGDDGGGSTDTPSAGATTAPPAGGPGAAPKEAPKPPPQQAQGGAPPADNKKEAEPEVPELAYWPKLTDSGGEFEKAMQQLKRMKVVASGFRKAQLEAKKKALDTVVLFGKYSEYATKHQEEANKHKAAIGDTKNEAQQSGNAAQQGDGQAAQGAGKQTEAQANNKPVATDVPQPEEPHGMFAVFARIVYRVKKWAADKAAAVFGWVQEKIASLIMQGLCGVSMNDIKQYTTALHHRMDFSKGIAVTAEGTTDKAKTDSQKTKSDSQKYAEEATNDALECDRNIADADTFVADVEMTEQDIVAEQTRATQFLAALKQEITAEKARKLAEKQKKEQEAQQAQAAQAAGANQPSPSPAAAPGQSPPQPAAPPAKKPKKPEVSEADRGKVKTAAAYVVTNAHLFSDQILGSQKEQSARLKASVEKKPKETRRFFENIHVGDGIVSTFKGETTNVETAMNKVQGKNLMTQEEVHGAVEAIKGSAKSLDAAANSASTALNGAFKVAYKAVMDSGPKKGAGPGPAANA